MNLQRTLEPEVMETPDEAREYNEMDHSDVNRVFVDDLLDCGDVALVGYRRCSLSSGVVGTCVDAIFDCSGGICNRVDSVGCRPIQCNAKAKSPHTNRITLLRFMGKFSTINPS